MRRTAQPAMTAIWNPPVESAYSLQPSTTHVWRFSLDGDERQLAAYHATLSDDEKTRASRYLFEHHRRRFIFCRGKQRRILASYVGARPAELEFHYSGRGKPRLRRSTADPPVTFNISNSQELGLCVVGATPVLGIDLEAVREIKDMLGLARRFFAEPEVRELEKLAGLEQRRAFFSIWTAKEAILKAVGKGLSYPLQEVVISAAPRRVARFGGDEEEAASWQLRQLAPGAGYVGAIASKRPQSDLRLWDLEEFRG